MWKNGRGLFQGNIYIGNIPKKYLPLFNKSHKETLLNRTNVRVTTGTYFNSETIAGVHFERPQFCAQCTGISDWKRSHKIVSKTAVKSSSVSCRSSWRVDGFVPHTAFLSKPTGKGQVGLNQVIAGDTQQILYVLSIERENCRQDRP